MGMAATLSSMAQTSMITKGLLDISRRNWGRKRILSPSASPPGDGFGISSVTGTISSQEARAT